MVPGLGQCYAIRGDTAVWGSSYLWVRAVKLWGGGKNFMGAPVINTVPLQKFAPPAHYNLPS